jgi:hypothetical protein
MDDFGIKYVEEENLQHLVSILCESYQISIDKEGTVIGHYSTLIDRRTKYIRPLVYLIDKNLLEPNISKTSSEISGHRSRPDLESGTSMMEVKAT